MNVIPTDFHTTERQVLQLWSQQNPPLKNLSHRTLILLHWRLGIDVKWTVSGDDCFNYHQLTDRNPTSWMPLQILCILSGFYSLSFHFFSIHSLNIHFLGNHIHSLGLILSHLFSQISFLRSIHSLNNSIHSLSFHYFRLHSQHSLSR